MVSHEVVDLTDLPRRGSRVRHVMNLPARDASSRIKGSTECSSP